MSFMPEWVKALCMVVSLLVSVVALYMSRRDRSTESQQKSLTDIVKRIDVEKSVTDARHEENIERFESLGGELATITERIKHLPGTKDIGKLYDQLRGVSSQVDNLQGAQKLSGELLHRINSYLMERK